MICAQDTWRMPAKIQEQQHAYCPDVCVTMENSYATTLAPDFYHLFSSPPNHPLRTIYLSLNHPHTPLTWVAASPPWTTFLQISPTSMGGLHESNQIYCFKLGSLRVAIQWADSIPCGALFFKLKLKREMNDSEVNHLLLDDVEHIVKMKRFEWNNFNYLKFS